MQNERDLNHGDVIRKIAVLEGNQGNTIENIEIH
jgi:hypothetical protein